MTSKTYIPLNTLAYSLGLPQAYVKREADAGRIPFVRAGRRRMFNLEQVEQALHNRSVKEVTTHA